MTVRLLLGDCRQHLAAMPADSVDALVVDPPYELGFMGRAWDRSGVAFDPETWAHCLRVTKPGGHLVAFGGTRTVHRIACAIEDAGWTIRDTLHWCYWSGFPKSQDVSAFIDALHGAEREVVGPDPNAARRNKTTSKLSGVYGSIDDAVSCPITAPATDDARKWSGWGTGVKPAVEPAILARKPLSESSVARNVLRWGTGALNLDACRFAPGDPMWPGPSDDSNKSRPGNMFRGHVYGEGEETGSTDNALGRFPANLLYCPKASRAERELGCEGLPTRTAAEATHSKEGQARLDSPRTGAGRTAEGIRNHHPTVKPLRLMRYLVRLVTPPGGLVCDPFMGSGTTGMAAVGQGFRFVGCELEADHMQIARARVEHAASGRSVECDLADVRTPAVQVGLFGAAR